MRILIIGDANSFWLKSVVEKTIDVRNSKVLICSYGNERYRDWYSTQGIDVLLIPQNRFGKLNMFVAAGQLKKRLKKQMFDLMIIHFVERSAMVIGLHLMSIARRSMVAFWGSDVFRAQRSTVLFFRYALKKYNHINITTDAMLDQFHQDYGHGLDAKITRARFGIFGLDLLKKCLACADLKADSWGIPEDKIIIAVGYNGHSAQQHIPVIQELKKMGKDVMPHIHLIFRMTYGGNQEYRDRVKKELMNSDFSYSILTDYLTDEDVAHLTCLTDIFINAQTTDALSASILEHLYAGVHVYNPTWILYRELEHEDVFCTTYSTFGELSGLLQTGLQKKDDFLSSEKLCRMQEYIEKLASWEKLERDWQNIYYEKR